MVDAHSPDDRRLVYLGNVVVDVVLTVPELPMRGGDVLASGTQSAVGGGFNVMAAASRQGLRTEYAGAHGTGPNADLARAALAAEGIALIEPANPELDSGFVVVLVDGGGERTFITSVGAEATLASLRLSPLRAGDTVCLSGYGLVHKANEATILDWLPSLANGVRCVFDPGPLVADIAESSLAAVLRRTDWLTCNASEAAKLAGIDQPAAAAQALSLYAGGKGALVRVGSDGCWLAQRGESGLHIKGSGVDAVDLNGAGDAHTGVFIAALAAGYDPAQAASRANAAAAIAVTRRGPATAPTLAELDSFLA